MRLIYLISACISFFLILPLHAQKKKKAHISLRLASVEPLPQKKYYLLTGKEASEEIHISSLRLSKKVSLKANKNYYLSTKIPDTEKGETPKTYAVCVFKTSKNYKEAIGILFKKKDTSKKHLLKLYQLNGSRASFKPGARKVFNLSKFPIQINFAGKKNKILAHGIKSISPPRSLKGRFLYAQGVFSTEKNKWNTFLSSYWVANPNVRSIIFIYPQANTRSLTFHGIDESL